MWVMLAGLVLFIGAHLVPTRRGLRAGLLGRLGEGGYKGLFALASLAGFVLIVWGYGLWRAEGPALLWDPPFWTRHVVWLLMVPAMILIVAAYAPTGRIKAAVKHPMLTAIKVWAFAHLLANGDAASVVLFGAFLAYAVVDRISMKRRERAGEYAPPVARGTTGDIVAVVAGLGLYVAILLWLHPVLFGVPAYP